jgi:asparagine synthase (glutamine-hydrolysing)
MCGFAGVIQYAGPPLTRAVAADLKRMADQIAHRGPDDEQFYCDSHLGLAFRRLAIVDIEQGGQPLLNEDESLVLVVNGEIYNHRDLRKTLRQPHTFRSQSDCEVILHLYEELGEGFLSQLNGMFALALWDKKKQKLLIARDRLGIKPLYYTLTAERLLFGSEIKALLSYPDCPRKLDWAAALANSLSEATARLPSFFEGIQYLKGGEYLVADARDGTVDVRSYWQLPSVAPDHLGDSRSAKQIIAGYHELLAESVALQLMSDVEIGLFLSGGIDSVAIAQLASRTATIPTFSVLSQSTFHNGDVEAAAKAARHLGLENHQVLYQWHEHSYDGDYWKRLLWHVESPLCSAEQLYKYELHRYARHHFPQLKSILLGQGSDEFNGGYCQAYVGPGDLHYAPEGNNWEVFLESVGRIEKSNLIRGRNSGLADYAHLLRKEYLAEQAAVGLQPGSWAYYTALNARNLQVYNLWHEDRTAAAHGIENRVPFLDHRLVEFTLQIPPKHHKELFWNKHILRAGFEGKLPADLVQRPKAPFFYGEHVHYTNRMLYNMIVADGRRLLYDALGDPTQKHPIIDRPQLEKYVDLVGADPLCAGLPTLLTLVNLGLLENILAGGNPGLAPEASHPALADRICIEDYARQEQAIADQFSLPQSKLSLDKPIRLAAGIRLLSDAQSVFYISIADKLEYVLAAEDYQEWIAFLSAVDGSTSIETLLHELKIEKSAVDEYLLQAFDASLIEYAD